MRAWPATALPVTRQKRPGAWRLVRYVQPSRERDVTLTAAHLTGAILGLRAGPMLSADRRGTTHDFFGQVCDRSSRIELVDGLCPGASRTERPVYSEKARRGRHGCIGSYRWRGRRHHSRQCSFDCQRAETAFLPTRNAGTNGRAEGGFASSVRERPSRSIGQRVSTGVSQRVCGDIPLPPWLITRNRSELTLKDRRPSSELNKFRSATGG